LPSFTWEDNGDGTVSFTDTSDPQGTTITYAWDFSDGPGDPSASTDQNPTVDYGAIVDDCSGPPCSYNVSLTVTTSIQSYSPAAVPDTVDVDAAIPTAAFSSANNADGTATLNAASSISGGPSVTIADPAGYVWTVPGLAPITGSNPTIDFTLATGSSPFTVTLDVTNDMGGTDQLVQPVGVTGAPVAGISAVEGPACTLTITDASTYPGNTSNAVPTTWVWPFAPDVGTASPPNSTAQNPGAVTFSGGTTSVIVGLTVTNKFGSDNTVSVVPLTGPCP
jgi:hypothetical protein